MVCLFWSLKVKTPGENNLPENTWGCHRAAGFSPVQVLNATYTKHEVHEQAQGHW